MLTDEELQNLATQELLRDARSAAVRAQLYGAHRWAKPKLLLANKRFLKQMILSGKKDKIGKSILDHDSHRDHDNIHRDHDTSHRDHDTSHRDHDSSHRDHDSSHKGHDSHRDRNNYKRDSHEKTRYDEGHPNDRTEHRPSHSQNGKAKDKIEHQSEPSKRRHHREDSKTEYKKKKK